jgi:hypothetical protein
MSRRMGSSGGCNGHGCPPVQLAGLTCERAVGSVAVHLAAGKRLGPGRLFVDQVVQQLQEEQGNRRG